MAKKMSAEDYIIDFQKEEESAGGRTKVKPGTYKVKIVGAKIIKSAEKGTPGLQLTLAFMDGNLRKRKKKLTETLWVSPKAYSRFRTLMESLELKVPKGKLDLKKLIARIKGKELWVEVVDEKDKSGNYPDKSVVAFDGFMGLDDYDPDDEDDDEDDDDEDEDEEDDDEDEDDEDDEDDDDDEDEDDEDEDDDDDDDDDEDEEPVKKGKKKKAAAKKAPAKKAKKEKKKKAADDDDDLDLDEF